MAIVVDHEFRVDNRAESVALLDYDLLRRTGASRGFHEPQAA
jgi:hypothetical protein